MSRARILLVDDEEDIRDALGTRLGAGHDVTVAADGEAAVEHARARRFDLAITDLRMPGMDGLQTIRALRTLDPSLAVIVMTGYTAPDTIAECERLGVRGYLRKPFDLDEFDDTVARALSSPTTAG